MKQYPKPVFDDALEERQRQEQEAAQRREALRLRVRERFPEITAFADQMREQFPGSRIVWAAEKQYVIGPVPQEVLQERKNIYGQLVDVSKEK